MGGAGAAQQVALAEVAAGGEQRGAVVLGLDALAEDAEAELVAEADDRLGDRLRPGDVVRAASDHERRDRS